MLSSCHLISESFIVPVIVPELFCQPFALPYENLSHIFVSSNPTPGIVINRPNGSDVYKGVPKDYTGEVSAYVYTKVQIKALA